MAAPANKSNPSPPAPPANRPTPPSTYAPWLLVHIMPKACRHSHPSPPFRPLPHPAPSPPKTASFSKTDSGEVIAELNMLCGEQRLPQPRAGNQTKPDLSSWRQTRLSGDVCDGSVRVYRPGPIQKEGWDGVEGVGRERQRRRRREREGERKRERQRHRERYGWFIHLGHCRL